jgi:atypical dual specificity phosphatase
MSSIANTSQSNPFARPIDLGTFSFLNWKHIWYKGSLYFIKLENRCSSRTWPWWNRITDHVFLGALPLNKHKQSLLALSKGTKGLGILSLVESFEFAQGMFAHPVSHRQWEEYGKLTQFNIKQLIVETPDIRPIHIDKIRQAVCFIKNMVSKNYTVYVHCKAGRGRSATVMACYLMEKDGLKPKEAVERVRKCRNQIRIYPWQLKTIEDYHAKYINCKKWFYYWPNRLIQAIKYIPNLLQKSVY